jgi:hypothetical protein
VTEPDVTETIWQPVVTADQTAAARDAITAILRDLQHDRYRSVNQRFSDPFIALLFAEVARDTGDRTFAAEALARLDRAIANLESATLSPALFGGFAGVAWLALRVPPLAGPLVDDSAGSATDGSATNGSGADGSAADDEPGDPCEEIDEVLVEALSAPKWKGPYDLISGLVGIGVYALERLSEPHGREMLRLIVEHLASLAAETPKGLTWWTAPEHLPGHQLKMAPRGFQNLGMAHGVPGVIALLGHVCRADVAVPQASRLLEGAVDWVLSEQLPEGPGARYPCWIVPGERQTPARLAWCYGGLGVASALMIAARALNHARWEAVAHEFGLLEASRAMHETLVRDTCLCHGSTGNAHIFRRFYHATGDERFLAAAKWWYSETFASRTSGQGIGGFQFYAPPLEGAASPDDWCDDPTFTSGAAGVGLALQAAIGTTTPGWDRLMLIDIPRER